MEKAECGSIRELGRTADEGVQGLVVFSWPTPIGSVEADPNTWHFTPQMGVMRAVRWG